MTTRSLLAGGLLVIALAACGNNATTAPECTDTPKNSDLGGGLLCVDTGFRFSADDFGFANWAGLDSATEDLRIDTLVKMYGADDAQNADKAAFVFIADESPLHRKLGVYENRG